MTQTTSGKDPAAITLGRRGGAATSEAKAAAARENGRKGGRPRKTKTPMQRAAKLAREAKR